MNSGPLDPRRHVIREDMAAASLKERVRAPRYSQGELRQVVGAVAPVRIVPRFDAPLTTEALCGELVTVYDAAEGWAWVQLEQDNYVGYMPMDNLSATIEEPTHWVSSRGTFVYPAPDMKRPPIMRLSFNSKVTVVGREGRFLELGRGGFAFGGHLQTMEDKGKDFVRLAEKLIGTPYLWGGRSGAGIDCSGLVQTSMQAAGLSAPRDSDMQEAEIGAPLPEKDLDKLARGDLVFWRGHVGMVQSAEWMIHASGHQMEVVVEPIRRAVERIATTHGDVTTIRRIAGLKLG
ncbi:MULTISPECIES: C40 family peptidase [Rhodomicrobium]|uniref:C40 family peptidase n=1 Tax=Rhodomicrobium TaxID=1068 RepID=UPI001482F43A|nr:MULTISPECIES: C40 family peptidase [Rhodomicrobium]